MKILYVFFRSDNESDRYFPWTAHRPGDADFSFVDGRTKEEVIQKIKDSEKKWFEEHYKPL